MINFTFFDIYGKFDCDCSLNKTNFQCMITDKSVKLECLKCRRIAFYRVVQ